MIEIKYNNRQWVVRTDPNQLPQEDLLFNSFEQVTQWVESEEGQRMIEADDSCPRPKHFYAGVGPAPRI